MRANLLRLVNGKALYDIKADPGQKKNVAGENPQVVEKLRKAYDAWWEGLSKRFDEYCEIIIGSPKENPSRITCHDWHGRGVPWNQGAVRGGAKANGFWAVEVARELARRKAEDVLAALSEEVAYARETDSLRVLGADTVVAVGDGLEQNVLGKPRDRVDAATWHHLS